MLQFFFSSLSTLLIASQKVKRKVFLQFFCNLMKTDFQRGTRRSLDCNFCSLDGDCLENQTSQSFLSPNIFVFFCFAYPAFCWDPVFSSMCLDVVTKICLSKSLLLFIVLSKTFSLFRQFFLFLGIHYFTIFFEQKKGERIENIDRIRNFLLLEVTDDVNCKI